MLTLEDFITSSGKYPKRAHSDELTETVRENLIDLYARVVSLLNELEVSPSVTSGFRTKEANEGKGRYHPLGKAVDLNDPSGAIKFNIIMNPHLLTKYGLWMEHYSATPGWVHLDTGTRPDRPVRIFKP